MRRSSLFTVLLIAATKLAISNAQVDLYSHCPRECFENWYTVTRSKGMAARAIVKKVLSVEQAEGVGALVRRSVGRPEVSAPIMPCIIHVGKCWTIIFLFSLQLKNLDPFLMLDEFKVRKPAGFPDHPHRGFETVREKPADPWPISHVFRTSTAQVTYMLQGSFQHEDFCGHRGTINPGDLQWMTAGRGIVHAEMPSGDGDNVGLQLWINLKKEDKVGIGDPEIYP